MVKCKRVENCCFCIPVHIGTYILGFAQVIGMLGQIRHFDPVVAPINGFLAFVFLWMWFNDSEETRLWFWYAFTAV